jgi:glutamate racemase
MGDAVKIVDSADATAGDVREFLEMRGMTTRSNRRGSVTLLVTDVPKTFGEVAARFLGEAVDGVEQVDL